MSALAQIFEINPETKEQLRGQPDLTVDFNPQSLRLTHTTPHTGGSQHTATTGGAPLQGPTHQPTGHESQLTVELLFDTTHTGTDVRDKTLKIVALSQPGNNGNAPAPGKAVSFRWGSFIFNGPITQVGETIDLFGVDGIPLRATLSLSIAGIAVKDSRPGSGGGLGLGAGAGLSAGFSASAGISAGAGVSAGVGASFGAGAGVSASAGVGASFGGGLSASAGASASASASFSASASASASASFSAGASASASASAGVGATPLQLTTSGDTVQSVAARAGVSWKALASANGVDNPRLLPPGTVLDVRVAVR